MSKLILNGIPATTYPLIVLGGGAIPTPKYSWDLGQTWTEFDLSGFGTFYFNQKKALTQYNKLLAIEKAYNNMLLDEKITEVKRNAVTLKLQIIATSIKTLKPKINV